MKKDEESLYPHLIFENYGILPKDFNEINYPFDIHASKETLFETMLKMEKEIELLQNDLDNANSKLKDYVGRCLKAIEYINTMPLTKGTEWYRIELLDILIGVDKDV